MTKIRVVAAVVDTKQLTLYTENGNTVLIPQGDPRLRSILDEITPVISQGGIAKVSVAEVNVYRDFEEQTGGFARFFRVAKNKVSGFFGAGEHEKDDNVAPTVVGTPPALSLAIDDIISNAKPAGGNLATNETVVAVVGSGKAARVIPGMENLKDQFIHASKLGSTKGVENFLRRLAAVIDQRQHSIHDLLRFMERGDLPIADDGSIVIYKILRSKGDRYVDCHSGNVPQRVGSYVCMDTKMVDHNRRNECSTGLHVARRGYLGNFGGDVCVLAKVAPEDVIAVPNYDANKMRVCGYHILFELDNDSFNKLKKNRPMTDNPKAQALLGRVISGNHIGRIEEVRITAARGGGVVTTPLNSKGQPQEQTKVRRVTALDDVASVPSVDPKAVAKQVTAAKAQPKTAPAGNTRQRTARALSDGGDIQALIAFKKAAKVSWASLGFSEEEQKHILEMAANPVPKPAPRPVTKPAPTVKAPPKRATPAPAKKVVAIDPASPKGDRTAKVTVDTSQTPSTITNVEISDPHPISKGTGRKVRLFELDKVYRSTKASPTDRANAALEMISIRGKAKKSWAALGYPKLTDQLLMNDVEKFQQKAAATLYPDTKAGQARMLFDQNKFGPLCDFKQSVKKGWSVLGFSDREIEIIIANKPGS